jgi:hypothetical protein
MIMKNKEKKISLIIAEIEGGGKHILVKSRINGTRAFLLIDTGASNSIFDKNFHIFDTQNFEVIGGNASSSSFNSDIEEFYTGEEIKLSMGFFRVILENPIFTQFGHVNTLYKSMGLPSIAGILGSDFLVEYNATLDFPNKQLTLRKNN